MQTEHLVANPHLASIEVNVLQAGNIVHCQRQIFFDKSGKILCSDQLIIREATQFDIAGIIDDTLELFHRLHELDNHLVIEFLRGDSPTAEGREVALLTRPLLRGLGKEEITLMGEIWALVEMAFKTPVQKG